jgi:ABC-type multidrug transport system fused ATPase/permease subunit
MLAFLFKVWGLAKPYRVRLFLGVLTGIVSGLMQPLMIGTVTFVYGAVFPSAESVASAKPPLRYLPEFAQKLYANARAGLADLQNGLHTHPHAILALIAAIPVIMFLRGLFGYLNVYFLQWTASRTIADLRTKLFAHLLNLSAGFFNGKFLRPAHFARDERHAIAAKHFERRDIRHRPRPDHAGRRLRIFLVSSRSSR